MVEGNTHLVGPRIGVEGRDAAFRAAFVDAMDDRPCYHWSPERRPERMNPLDVVVVEGKSGAEFALAHWPDVALVRWGRPAEPVTDVSWDAWISRTLDAPDAADVLIELMAVGLLGRFHGPKTASKPAF